MVFWFECSYSLSCVHFSSLLWCFFFSFYFLSRRVFPAQPTHGFSLFWYGLALSLALWLCGPCVFGGNSPQLTAEAEARTMTNAWVIEFWFLVQAFRCPCNLIMWHAAADPANVILSYSWPLSASSLFFLHLNNVISVSFGARDWNSICMLSNSLPFFRPAAHLQTIRMTVLCIHFHAIIIIIGILVLVVAVIWERLKFMPSGSSSDIDMAMRRRMGLERNPAECIRVRKDMNLFAPLDALGENWGLQFIIDK